MMCKLTSKKTRNCKMALMAVFAEIIILMDSLAAWLGNIFTDNVIIRSITSFGFTYLFWIGGIFAIIVIYRKNSDIQFNYSYKPDKKHMIYGLIIVCIAVIISVVSWGGFKIVKELMYGIKNGGIEMGIAYFVLQYFYYFLEVILMLIIVAFMQEIGESLFKSKKVPYGGIALALLWGLIHIAFHGVLDGLISTFNAVLYGYAFLFMRKNTKYAFPLIFLMFVL